ncbi:hypothetical protein TWF173_004104 [Orbilia oligospora]|nr:hypothetical protein TWF173_004104 [Orbilia oligospora]
MGLHMFCVPFSSSSSSSSPSSSSSLFSSSPPPSSSSSLSLSSSLPSKPSSKPSPRFPINSNPNSELDLDSDSGSDSYSDSDSDSYSDPIKPPATMVNKRKKKSDNSGDEGDKSDASERRGRRTRWWSLRSRSGPGGGSEAELGEEYRSFDAAKAVRPSPRVVDYLPKPSERAAKFGTPPSILKESGGPRRFDFPLPAPTEAERNWRHTISRIPGAVAGAVLKERASVDFDKKSRVHGYFQSDPIYLTENTTPERRPSPPPVEHSLSEYLDSLVHSDQAKAKSNKDDNNNKDNQNPQLNYSSLFDEFQGEKLPPAATEKPRRRRSVVFVEPEVPLNRNRRSLRPRPSSGPATAATAATTALAQIKAQQQQASSSSRGNPGSSSSSSGNKKSKPSKKGFKDKKDPKDGGDENKP